MKNWVRILLLILSGALVGFINGFLGAGGGIIVVPVLGLILNLDVKERHATAIFVILPLCVVSGIVYLVAGVCDFFVFGWVFVGSLVGSLIGAKLLFKLKGEIISMIFSVIIVIAGVLMVVL